MTPYDERVLACGILLGAAVMARTQHSEIDAIDQRLKRVEQERHVVRWLLRSIAPVGWRHGRRLYRIG